MQDDLTLEATTGQPSPLREYAVRGGGGVMLHAREWGNPDGAPILFIHGWSQCDLCWSRQLAGPLGTRFRMVTFDHRGHGMSEKPTDPESYADGRLWADDLAAVIDTAELERPVLVAWSYGGFVVADYLRVHGEDDIGGIDLVGAAVLLRQGTFDHFGPGLLENAEALCLPDLPASIAALQRFLGACSAQPLANQVWRDALCWNMVVPPEVRGALIARELDNDDVLARLSIPVLVTHGRDDQVVLPSMAEHTLAVCAHAKASWYDDVGHMPFAEAAERFDRELAELVELRPR
jgi:non-heme chloroperoxidase